MLDVPSLVYSTFRASLGAADLHTPLPHTLCFILQYSIMAKTVFGCRCSGRYDAGDGAFH